MLQLLPSTVKWEARTLPTPAPRPSFSETSACLSVSTKQTGRQCLCYRVPFCLFGGGSDTTCHPGRWLSFISGVISSSFFFFCSHHRCRSAAALPLTHHRFVYLRIASVDVAMARLRLCVVSRAWCWPTVMDGRKRRSGRHGDVTHSQISHQCCNQITG